MPPTFEQLETIKRRIKDAFGLFEIEVRARAVVDEHVKHGNGLHNQPIGVASTKEKRGMVDEREIPTIIRSLGINPAQDQLRDLITEIRGEENTTGCVEFDRFEKVMIRILTDEANNYKRDSEEKILRAFRAFDPEVRKLGKITTRIPSMTSCRAVLRAGVRKVAVVSTTCRAACYSKFRVLGEN
eukprot:318054-Prorocentrum_minimum.AAC.3